MKTTGMAEKSKFRLLYTNSELALLRNAVPFRWHVDHKETRLYLIAPKERQLMIPSQRVAWDFAGIRLYWLCLSVRSSKHTAAVGIRN